MKKKKKDKKKLKLKTEYTGLVDKIIKKRGEKKREK
jgi:hypothetical protein